MWWTFGIKANSGEYINVLERAGQSQVNTDPGIDKQVLKGVALILKGVNTEGLKFH